MSYNVGIILGLLISFGSVFVTLLLYFVCYRIAFKCYERKNTSEPEEQPPVEEVVRPQRSQYSETTIRFFEEFGINGYQRDTEAEIRIEEARQNRVRPADILPQYHEVADSNLPSYHEAVNFDNPIVYRIENERY